MELEEIRTLVLTHYSIKEYPCCVKCGFSDERALCLDHVNGDGNLHRSTGKYLKGINLYKKLYKNNFKCDYDLQTLCSNCNTIKVIEEKELCYKRNNIWKNNISKALKGKKGVKGKNSNRARKVAQFSLEGNLIKEWDYIKEAELNFNSNTNAKNIVACCNNRQQTAYGFIWQHIN
ncbi:MAG: hypothetical protein ACSLE0_23455 [Chitinophagaceae bacterium]